MFCRNCGERCLVRGIRQKKSVVFLAYLPKGWSKSDLLHKGMTLCAKPYWVGGDERIMWGDPVKVEVTIKEIGY